MILRAIKDKLVFSIALQEQGVKYAATTTNDLFGAPADGILPVKKTERKMYIDFLYSLLRFFKYS